MTVSTKAIIQTAKDIIEDISPATFDELFSDFEYARTDAIPAATEKIENIAVITAKTVIHQAALTPSKPSRTRLLRFINNPNGKFIRDKKSDINPNIKVLLRFINDDNSYLLFPLYSEQSFISAIKPFP